MGAQLLNVIDEEGNVLRQEQREVIHREGLLHADIHVWFYTPSRTLIFQHRSKTKDTYPNLLDATVGGHVDIGDSYEQAALRETLEETGIGATLEDLTFIRTILTKASDPTTGTKVYHRRKVYAYCFTGRIEDLQVEEGESAGFEAWSLEKLSSLSEEENKLFIPYHLTEEGMGIIRQVLALA